MKSKKRISVLIAAVLAVGVLGLAGVAYAAWTAQNRVDNNSIQTGSVTLTEFATGDAFAVTGLVPYDQGSGTVVVFKAYTVAAAGTISIDNLVNTGGLDLRFKVTTDAGLLAAPGALDDWTAVAEGGTVVTAAVGTTYYVNVILVSTSAADMNQAATFDLVLAA